MTWLGNPRLRFLKELALIRPLTLSENTLSKNYEIAFQRPVETRVTFQRPRWGNVAH